MLQRHIHIIHNHFEENSFHLYNYQESDEIRLSRSRHKVKSVTMIKLEVIVSFNVPSTSHNSIDCFNK
ncbi:hypothetical protein HanIR_Chr17g0873451 [Helianthus annuus]|nr:hypothetical protein HanIR_Chr17g0873451 [Helianthus annuus]